MAMVDIDCIDSPRYNRVDRTDNAMLALITAPNAMLVGAPLVGARRD
jgi:hypothetical protein